MVHCNEASLEGNLLLNVVWLCAKCVSVVKCVLELVSRDLSLIMVRGGWICTPIDPRTVFCVSGCYSLSVFGPQTVDLLSQSTMGNNDY